MVHGADLSGTAPARPPRLSLLGTHSGPTTMACSLPHFSHCLAWDPVSERSSPLRPSLLQDVHSALLSRKLLLPQWQPAKLALSSMSISLEMASSRKSSLMLQSGLVPSFMPELPLTAVHSNKGTGVCDEPGD